VTRAEPTLVQREEKRPYSRTLHVLICRCRVVERAAAPPRADGRVWHVLGVRRRVGSNYVSGFQS